MSAFAARMRDTSSAAVGDRGATRGAGGLQLPTLAGFLFEVSVGRRERLMLATHNLAKNLRRLRHEADLSQAALGARAGSRQTRISLLEHGCVPTDDEVDRLAAALGVPVAALLRRTRRAAGLNRTSAITLPAGMESTRYVGEACRAGADAGPDQCSTEQCSTGAARFACSGVEPRRVQSKEK